jgi:hypothetical protein
MTCLPSRLDRGTAESNLAINGHASCICGYGTAVAWQPVLLPKVPRDLSRLVEGAQPIRELVGAHCDRYDHAMKEPGQMCIVSSDYGLPSRQITRSGHDASPPVLVSEGVRIHATRSQCDL